MQTQELFSVHLRAVQMSRDCPLSFLLMCAMESISLKTAGSAPETLILSPDLSSLKLVNLARWLKQEIACFMIFLPTITANKDIKLELD